MTRHHDNYLRSIAPALDHRPRLTAIVTGSILLALSACSINGARPSDEGERDFADDESNEPEDDGRPAGIVFPADSGVINVTDPAIGAFPNDGIDDTAALQAMLDANPSGNKVFYFPDGVYEISDTLRPQPSNGVAKRNIFQGQSEAGTVLELADGLLDAAGQPFAGALINYGSGPAQLFRNAVRDLTIDTGVDNPAATGLRFNASNQGVVRNVTIRSGDGQGAAGLDLGSASEIGPLLVKNLTVEGFERGLLTRAPTASQTFEGITLVGQTQTAWLNTDAQAVFARDVTVEGPASRGIINDGEGQMLIVDSSLTNTAGNGAQGIFNQKALFARNVATTGYAQGVNRAIANGRGNVLTNTFIEEYWANGAYPNPGRRRGGTAELFESPDTTLDLPVEDTPEVPWSALHQWAGPHQFGGAPSDGIDDTAALQAAIDSGAETIYLQNGTWNVSGELVMRDSVIRLIGAEARLTGDTATLRIPGAGPTLILERMEIREVDFVHEGTRTLVLADLSGGSYEAAGADTGDVFIEDCVLAFARFRDQKAYARQLNIENQPDQAKVQNDGADVWILGFKTEDSGVQVLTTGGGRTDLLGAKHVGGFADGPRYVTVDSAFSVALPTGNPTTVQETRNGETRTGSFDLADVYTAIDPAALWELRGEIQIDDADASGVELLGALVPNSDPMGPPMVSPWRGADSQRGGWIGPQILIPTLSAPNPDTMVRFTPDLPQAGSYKVYGRWSGEQSGRRQASNAPLQIEHAGGTTVVAVNQRQDHGEWVELGTFEFLAGPSGSVTIQTEGADGVVIVDAVRFILQ